MVRVYRLFDLRFASYPRRWITAILGAAIYANFFTHHYIWDLRWVLLAAVVVIYGRCVMHFRVFRKQFRMPLVIAFLLVALFIWIAENIATWSGAWLYPSQMDGWHPVGLEKLVAWFLLMIISVVLVAWVYKPQPPAETATTAPAGPPPSNLPPPNLPPPNVQRRASGCGGAATDPSATAAGSRRLPGSAWCRAGRSRRSGPARPWTG
jgi:hypothetical protein